MQKAWLVAALTLAVVAGCGNGKTATPTTPADPGRDVMDAFVTAAANKDAAAMWELLSRQSQRRAGPTVAEFARGEAQALERTLAPFAPGPLPVNVSERIDDEFGLVALSRGRHAYATPLRLENRFWRVELPGPLRIDVLGPPPNSRGKFVGQIGVEVHGPGPERNAVIYADGVALDARTYAGPNSETVFANFATPLEAGRHTAVAFADRGRNAAAVAWTFVAS